jgi:hypothetical protein
MKQLLVLVGLIALSGCATLGDVMQEKSDGGGTAKVYAVPVDQAWEIARTVLRWEGSDVIEEHRSEGCMLTSFGMNLVSAGTVAGAWIEPSPAGSSRVTVVTTRRVQTNIATVLTEAGFHRRFEQAVEILKREGTLPFKAPSE